MHPTMHSTMQHSTVGGRSIQPSTSGSTWWVGGASTGVSYIDLESLPRHLHKAKNGDELCHLPLHSLPSLLMELCTMAIDAGGMKAHCIHSVCRLPRTIPKPSLTKMQVTRKRPPEKPTDC